MSVKRKKFDFDSPEVKAQVDEFVHGPFVRQGTMVAFPTGFPGSTTPIVPDESHITSLDTTPDGIIYGGTSGKRSHIFVAMFHGVTGMVFDLKILDDASQCPAICCGKSRVMACVNGPRGGRILSTPLQPLPYDLIQEWAFERPAFADGGECVPGEPILHAVTDGSRGRMVGITTRHLFTVDMETSKVNIVAEVNGAGRLAMGSLGSILGTDETRHLWRFDPRTQTLDRAAFELPPGSWATPPRYWARDGLSGLLYTADNAGVLFSFDEKRGFSTALGKTMLAPVGPMAVTFDGRVFGFCGSEMAKMFCYDPNARSITDLGVAVSVFERRRYGYIFGDAVTGREGEILFGEDDNSGHLWLYFPRVQSRRTT